MTDIIYVERQVASHPRTERILARYPKATIVWCERYGEVFNRRAQNFRLQKRRPALILAAKHDRFVLQAPAGHGVGGDRQYYFAHLLGCPYDCRYCFLQGMVMSANYVLFVNYEDFAQEIITIAKASRQQQVFFFSGYDSDSLALDEITEFSETFLPLFDEIPNAWLELRTKSVRTRGLESRPPCPRAIIAYSLSPEALGTTFEQHTPPVQKRIAALTRLSQHGYPIGLRFDPLVYFEGFEDAYAELFSSIFARLDPAKVHSASLGVMRFPKVVFDRIVKLYPDEALFAGPFITQDNTVSYSPERSGEMLRFCYSALSQWLPEQTLFQCGSPSNCSGSERIET